MMLEVRNLGTAVVLRGVGELDERLAALVGDVAASRRSLPVVVDLSELTLTRPPVLQLLLQQLVPPAREPSRPAVVVCSRLSARRVVRQAAGTARLPVVATLDQALGWFHLGRGAIGSADGGSWPRPPEGQETA